MKDRLHRSELAVPAISMKMMEKAPTAGADVVFLDLEDAIAPDDKQQARENCIFALNNFDWSKCAVSVRINSLDTYWCYRDVVDVVEQAGQHLDTILIPKVGLPSDVEFIATLLDQIETSHNLEPINIHILIETALGMANVEAIAQARPDRMEAMVFGVADYAASTQARTTRMGGANENYTMLGDADDSGNRTSFLGNQWHFAMSRLVVACRAYGLRPIDGPYGDIKDTEGYLSHARSVAALGMEGKWCIHPSQIKPAHEVFTPGEAEVTQAQRILDAMQQAAKEGKGAISLDGALIDAASIRQAEVITAKYKQINDRA